MTRALALLLACLCTGCLGTLNAVDRPTAVRLTQLSPAQAEQRSHVHVYLINGADPTDAANLSGLRDYLEAVGFANVTQARFFHTAALEARIAAAREADPMARVAIVGYDIGAWSALTLAKSLDAAGKRPDLLVLLNGQYVEHLSSGPLPAVSGVHVRSTSWLAEPVPLAGADDVLLERPWHLGLPTSGEGVETLTRRLNDLARAVPAANPVLAPAAPLLPPAPPPRPVAETVAAAPDEWDFLKPR